MITIRSSELIRFRNAANSVDRKIVSSVRKQLRLLGKPMVEKVQETARSGSRGGDSADQIAAGTRLTLSFAKSGGGVRITTTNARLSAGHKGFVAAFNKPTFRHPVFGNRRVFVEQTGRPYFGSVIAEMFDKRTEKAMKAVFVDAVEALGGRV